MVAGGQVSDNACVDNAVHPKWRSARSHVRLSQSYNSKMLTMNSQHEIAVQTMECSIPAAEIQRQLQLVQETIDLEIMSPIKRQGDTQG